MPSRPSSPSPVAGRRRALRIGAPAAIVLSLVLSGCGGAIHSMKTMTNPADARVYASASDGVGRLPPWIPADATGIHLKTSFRGDGSLLVFRTATPVDQLPCTASTGDTKPPSVRDTWWPDGAPPATMTCGGWHAFTRDGTVYAWLDAGSPALDL